MSFLKKIIKKKPNQLIITLLFSKKYKFLTKISKKTEEIVATIS